MDVDEPTPVDAQPHVETPDGGPSVVTESAGTVDASTGDVALDLDAITADLDGVEVALTRLGDGTYWTDEVTGEPLPDELLAAFPTARRA